MRADRSTANARNAALVDLTPAPASFLADVVAGLSQPQKRLPSKYFYDETGSRLFEDICGLDAYYPTRTEIAILTSQASVLGAWLPRRAAIIEYGSGSAVKIRRLLDAAPDAVAYVPIDISREPLLAHARSIAAAYPRLSVIPVCADFNDDIDFDRFLPAAPRVGFFPGSTIGNLTPLDAIRFLKRAARALGVGGVFVVGVDMKKDIAVLEAAYNDAEGVTARFNLNILVRINRELGADFDTARFRHRAFYNIAAGRIEMHLECLRAHEVRIDRWRFAFRGGETIHTENSCKYDIGGFQALAAAAGYRPAGVLVDERRLFSVHGLCVGVGPA